MTTTTNLTKGAPTRGTAAAGNPTDRGDETPALSVRNLTKEFPIRGGGLLRRVVGAVQAVTDVSFDLYPHETLGLVGESGCGKSTTGRAVLNLQRATSGQVVFKGKDITQLSERQMRPLRRDLQIVFQDPYTSLDRRQSIDDCWAEVLRLHFKTSAQETRRRVRELANMVGLDEGQLRARPGALSGGQRQRVAIARALAAEPQVVVLDESLAALDVSIQAQVLNLLADVRQATGVTFLLISHDLAVVRQLADDVLVMRGGVIVESGSTPQVLDSPTHPYTQLLLASVPRPGWKPATRTLSATAPDSTRLIPTAKEHP